MLVHLRYLHFPDPVTFALPALHNLSKSRRGFGSSHPREVKNKPTERVVTPSKCKRSESSTLVLLATNKLVMSCLVIPVPSS